MCQINKKLIKIKVIYKRFVNITIGGEKMNITNEVINEIRNKVDIVDIISNYIPLTQRGKNYFGVCPFHDDHSPSMSVSREKQIFTCFSCNATGNVFTFVSNYEHIEFYEAVRLLGTKVGYNLGNVKNTKKKNSDLYDIYNLACRFYQNNLNTINGKNAQEYLENRKIVIFGSGIRGTQFSLMLKKNGYQDICFTDNNEKKVGCWINEYPIIPVSSLLGMKSKIVILISTSVT